MSSLLLQIQAVVLMNIRSLPQRAWMSVATLLAVAVVVAVLLAFLAMGDGFRATVANSGSNALAIALREGAQAELNSGLTREQVNILEAAPGILHDAQGPLVSAELYVIVDGYKRSTNSEVNLPLRGLSPRGVQLREGAHIIKGRMFEEGKNEIVVGAGVLREFTGFELGKEIKLGTATWTVVGVFEAGGSVFESELWADVRILQSQFNRGSSYQVVRMALQTPGEIAPIVAYVKNDPQLNLDIFTEKDYFGEQAKQTSDLIFYLGWPLSIIMAFGALAGALNTMYTAVAQRATEIATLRAIGFSNIASAVGVLAEALLLSLLGGVLGTVAAYLFFDGVTASTLGGSFSQVVFAFDMSADTFVQGITMALVIGLVGGFFPAWRAARLPVIKAFAVNG
ncbi:MAG: ABC transporter permease [Pseudomonadales bacterium]|nr:ABC transporter permease [Pseudomonadales bacterium]